jgi:hypothetical protein
VSKSKGGQVLPRVEGVWECGSSCFLSVFLSEMDQNNIFLKNYFWYQYIKKNSKIKYKKLILNKIFQNLYKPHLKCNTRKRHKACLDDIGDPRSFGLVNLMGVVSCLVSSVKV